MASIDTFMTFRRHPHPTFRSYPKPFPCEIKPRSPEHQVLIEAASGLHA